MNADATDFRGSNARVAIHGFGCGRESFNLVKDLFWPQKVAKCTEEFAAVNF
jgi:hypothetical protein